MAIINLTKEQRNLVEKIGVRMEMSGSSPTEGRIIALLIVSDETELSFEDIQETLQISKSSTSTTLNVLLTTNKIDYITRPGERKRYFRNRIDKWEQDFIATVEFNLSFSELLKEVLNLRSKNTPEFNDNLKKMIHFLDYLKISLPILLKKWQDQIK